MKIAIVAVAAVVAVVAAGVEQDLDGFVVHGLIYFFISLLRNLLTKFQAKIQKKKKPS